MIERADIAVIGAGAAGLMAAIWAGRTAKSAGRPLRIVALDGAKTLGAKILVAGGGRCNVTHFEVDETAFAGSTPPAIRKVLRRFGVPQTIEFFRELGVELKREETGKLFPTTDDARTVLNALLKTAREAGVELVNPWRVDRVEHGPDGVFMISVADTKPQTQDPRPHGVAPTIHAARVIIATGGRSLPKTGSDGHGYSIVRALGHTTTDRIFAALVPLMLPEGHFVRSLSGITVPATLEVRSGTGKRLESFTNSTLCTHFGLSGPSVLDISRYWIDARADDPGASLVINWLPERTPERLDAALQALGKRMPLAFLRDLMPERLARALCEHAAVDANTPGSALTREVRRALVRAVCEHVLPVSGDRGFAHAEVTAGGVPLSELDLSTMESRRIPGLYIIGEICDVDGRIGGFNFQWAWASGYVAGCAAATATDQPRRHGGTEKSV